VIKTAKDPDKKKSEDLVHRAMQIAGAMRKIVSEAAPDSIYSVVCESMSWPRDSSSAVAMAIAWGAVAASLSPLNGNSIAFIATQTAKRHFTNKRDAEKIEVENAVIAYYKQQYNDDINRFLVHLKNADREHVFDALAAGYTAMNQAKKPKRGKKQ
jgi:Holliday junction resolvasome RuvABC endonuclease subunit